MRWIVDFNFMPYFSYQSSKGSYLNQKAVGLAEESYFEYGSTFVCG